MAPSHETKCKVCNYGPENLDWEVSNAALSRIVDCSKDSILRHRKWAMVNGFLPETVAKTSGDESGGPEWRARRKWQAASGEWMYSYEAIHSDDDDPSIPDWPLVDRPNPLPSPVKVTPSLIHKWKTGVAGADSQIGFRFLSDGTVDTFHDDSALQLFVKLVELENPDQTYLAGDIVDLPEQSKYAQEPGFARTTQMSLDRTYEWLSSIRGATGGAIHLIEGNHDKRLQNFVQWNAMSAFGLRRASWPDGWPVMSMPYLLRLDELDIEYYDAYPQSHVWVNNHLRVEHGTKANSKGSTAQKYLDETPHVSRIIGHSHRQEIIQRTTWDRAGKIKSQVINPGALCRVDGAVPGFNSSIGASGKPAEFFEDWQQGAAIIRYTDDQFFSELVQFEDGIMVYRGQEYTAR